MKTKYLKLGFEIKEVNDEEMTFTAYGNTKNYVDHAKDVTVSGAYQKSIERHKEAGTMPKLLWSHDRKSIPIGVITEMKEDDHGLLFKGRLNPESQDARAIHWNMKNGGLESFSIGYTVQDEEYDREKQVNYLKEIDVKEISAVNFPCNDQSLLQDVKSRLEDDELPSLRDVQKLLQKECGLSKRQAEKTMAQFEEKGMWNVYSVIEMLCEMPVGDVHKLVEAANAFLTEIGEIDDGDEKSTELDSILSKFIQA